MNSLQRVMTTISHKEPDRVAIGEWGIDHDHVSEIIGKHTYWRNRRDTLLALWENRREEVVQGMKEDYVKLIDKLEYDVLTVSLVPPKSYHCDDPPRKIADGVWEDSKGNIYKYAASNDSISCMTHPSARDDISQEEVDKAIENIPDFEDGEFELIDHICERYGKEKAVLFRGIVIDEYMLQFFGGDDSHRLMMPVLNPDAVKRCGRYALEINKRLLSQCEKRNIPIIMAGRDYGNKTGCMESPKTIRELYMPFHKKFNEYVTAAGRIPFLHCCGCVWDIVQDFIEVGYQGYQSIQGSAGMELAKVKKLYGDKLTLWAGVQCETLVEGSGRQVQEEVKKSLEDCMPDGGFIFGSTNSVQYGAKTENYLQALDLVRKHGVYK